MQIVDNVGTYILTGETITIVKEWGIRSISFNWISGTVTVTGIVNLGARASEPIPLGVKPLNLGFDFSIDGLTINAMAGVVQVVVGK